MSQYGCYNRPPFVDLYPAPDGHWTDGQVLTIKASAVKVSGSRDCQYTLSNLGRRDPKCDGCCHRAAPEEFKEQQGAT